MVPSTPFSQDKQYKKLRALRMEDNRGAGPTPQEVSLNSRPGPLLFPTSILMKIAPKMVAWHQLCNDFMKMYLPFLLLCCLKSDFTNFEHLFKIIQNIFLRRKKMLHILRKTAQFFAALPCHKLGQRGSGLRGREDRHRKT